MHELHHYHEAHENHLWSPGRVGSWTVDLRKHHTFAWESLVSFPACEDPFEVVFSLDLLVLPSGLGGP
jgi:hypothetical protein